MGSIATDLYLDLLKKSITNTLYSAEPDGGNDNQLQFVQDFIRHYINGAAISMLPMSRLDNLQYCIADVIDKRVPGDFIETGVWRGGTTIFMRASLKAYGVADRRVWVADSFQGLPEPDAEKFPIEASVHRGSVMKNAYNHFAASLDEVKHNFLAFGMLDDQVQFLPGWFKDTLATAPISKLAILRLDGDYYESTLDGLNNLYHKISPGGYVIVDDYGQDTWTYCRQAVNDFRAEHRIDEPMLKVDGSCYYWRRRQFA